MLSMMLSQSSNHFPDLYIFCNKFIVVTFRWNKRINSNEFMWTTSRLERFTIIPESSRLQDSCLYIVSIGHSKSREISSNVNFADFLYKFNLHRTSYKWFWSIRRKWSILWIWSRNVRIFNSWFIWVGVGFREYVVFIFLIHSTFTFLRRWLGCSETRDENVVWFLCVCEENNLLYKCSNKSIIYFLQFHFVLVFCWCTWWVRFLKLSKSFHLLTMCVTQFIKIRRTIVTNIPLPKSTVIPRRLINPLSKTSKDIKFKFRV